MALTKIAEASRTGVTSINFDTDIDSTYKVYKFVFLEINPAASSSSVWFTFQGGAGSYATTMTTTFWKAEHYLTGGTGLGYDTAGDQAQGSAYQNLFQGIGDASTENMCGELFLFNPSSTTYVKHFMSENIGIYGPYSSQGAVTTNVAGYFNVVTAITSIGFKMSDDSAFDGTIQMWGL